MTDQSEYRWGDPVAVSDEAEHMPDCKAVPVYKVGASDPAVYIAQCVEGCEHRPRSIRRGQELAEEHGWL